MAAHHLSTRATKERQVSNRRKRSSDVSRLEACVHGWREERRLIYLLICLGLVALTWAVFGQTIRYHFVNFDDDLYVYNTPAIQSGLTLKGIAAAFIGQHAHNWHPLTTISTSLDC